MRGASSLIVDIRMPTLGLRAAPVDWSRWPVKAVRISSLRPIPVPSYSFDPVGLELSPGYHHVSFLDKEGAIVLAREIRIVRGATTIVTVFPPTRANDSRLVRRDLTVEVSEIGSCPVSERER
jgi:hypothetical protein